MTSNCNLEEGKLEKIKILKEELKERIDELTENIESTQNLGFTSQKEIETITSNINVLNSKIENNEENKKDDLIKLPNTGNPFGSEVFAAMGVLATIGGSIILKKKHNDAA